MNENSIITYNDNGTPTSIFMKSGDTLPIGARVKYNGNTIPNGYREVQDEIVETIFAGPQTSINQITLFKPFTDYKTLRFWFGSNESTTKKDYIDIDANALFNTDNSTHLYVGPIAIHIGGKGASMCFLRTYKIDTIKIVLNQIPLYSWGDNGALTITANGASVVSIEGIKEA